MFDGGGIFTVRGVVYWSFCAVYCLSVGSCCRLAVAESQGTK